MGGGYADESSSDKLIDETVSSGFSVKVIFYLYFAFIENFADLNRFG